MMQGWFVQMDSDDTELLLIIDITYAAKWNYFIFFSNL